METTKKRRKIIPGVTIELHREGHKPELKAVELIPQIGTRIAIGATQYRVVDMMQQSAVPNTDDEPIGRANDFSKNDWRPKIFVVEVESWLF